MGRRPARAQCLLIQFVEGGNSPRKEFTVDHTFAEWVGDPEAQSYCQFAKSPRNALHVARLKRRYPIAHHHPVQLSAIGQPPLLAGPPPQSSVIALTPPG